MGGGGKRRRSLAWRDDNLAYLDSVALYQAAVASIPDGHNRKVITVWPGSSEVSKSWLGYRNQPLQDIEIDSFTQNDLIAARQDRPQNILMFPRGHAKREIPFHAHQGITSEAWRNLHPTKRPA